MAALSDTVHSILDDHPELAEQARDGDDKAENQLIAKVMSETSVDANIARVSLTRALENGDDAAVAGVDVDGFEEHMEQLAERGDRSEWTKTAYVVSVRRFADWFEDEYDDADMLPTVDHVREWLDHLALEEGKKGSTIQRHYHGIQAYWKWTGRSGELSDIDVSDSYPDTSGGTPDHLEWDEVEAIREATVESDPNVICTNPDCPREPWTTIKDRSEYDSPPRCPSCNTRRTLWSRRPYEFAVVQLLSGLGIRVGELVEIELDDLHLDDHYVSITREKRKKQWEDTMYLLDSDIEAIRLYLQYREDEFTPMESGESDGDSEAEDPRESDKLFITNRKGQSGWAATTDYIRALLNDAAIRADVRTFEEDGETKTQVSPHWLRHTVGARLAQKGYTEFQVSQYLGHARRGVTERYMSLDPEQTREMREAIERSGQSG